MAEVFRGVQTGMGGFEKPVAVKRLLPHFADDEAFKKMFQIEVNLCARFQHPNIVQVFSNGEADGYLYLVMEFVNGKNLGQLSSQLGEKKQRLPIVLACFIAAEAAKGLDYAHRFTDEQTGANLNVIHRDVSPQNIMISYDGQVKVVDFGIAKAADRAEMTDAGIVRGKVAYMAPEQARGEQLDRRIDIFSLGILLHEMLSNRRLFRADTRTETMKNVVGQPIAPPSQFNPGVLPELDRIVLRALERDREARYQSARELHRDLAVYISTNYPRFVPTELADFMTALFAGAINDDLRNHQLISSELAPTSITPSSGDQLAKTVVETKSHTAPRIRHSPEPAASRPTALIVLLLVALGAAAGVWSTRASKAKPVEPRVASEVGGLIGWFKTESLQLEHGDRVTRWPSASGLVEAVQAEEKNQPVLTRSAINGLSAVTFDGKTQFMTADKLAEALRRSTAMTAIYVARAHSDKTAFVWSMHGSLKHNDSCRAGYAAGEKVRVKANDSVGRDYDDSKKQVIYGFSVYSVVFEYDRVTAYLDGVEIINSKIDQPIDYADASYFSIGQEYDDKGPSDFFDGALAELAVYDRALREEERAAVEAYLAKKYGLATR